VELLSSKVAALSLSSGVNNLLVSCELGFLAPEKRTIGGLDWLVTERLMKIRSQHADLYMPLVVTLTREALEKMHKYELAHQDVRYPNVCFYSPTNKFEDLVALMIDLDRVETATRKYTAVKFKGDMYQPPEDAKDCTYAQQDMKQLAMMCLEHHKTDSKTECPCDCCKELREVVKTGGFKQEGSLFTRQDPDFVFSLESFYQALRLDSDNTRVV
jgi:hypothetical protein